MAIILSFQSLTAFDIHGWKTGVFRIYYTCKQLCCQLKMRKNKYGSLPFGAPGRLGRCLLLQCCFTGLCVTSAIPIVGEDLAPPASLPERSCNDKTQNIKTIAVIARPLGRGNLLVPSTDLHRRNKPCTGRLPCRALALLAMTVVAAARFCRFGQSANL